MLVQQNRLAIFGFWFQISQLIPASPAHELGVSCVNFNIL